LLTTKQRAHLKSLAHPLKPIHHIGREGVTQAAVAAVAEAFNQRELLKVKVQQTSPVGATEAAIELVARLPGVELVQTIGRTLVLYKRHPQTPDITLPH
jgi:RNA-binding protein